MITVEKARELLAYNPETGELRWRKAIRCGNGSRAVKVKAGDIAGHTDKRGYRLVMIDYKNVQAHRLAWMIFYGELPPKIIDHANGDAADNRIGNLRKASVAQNQQNKKLQRNSTTGLKGVSFRKADNVWVATITLNKRQRHLGRFRCPTAAHIAYCQAAKEHFGPFARSK